MAPKYVGRPLKRREDPKLIQGLDPYVADVPLPDALAMVVARSSYAHAGIRSIDAWAAHPFTPARIPAALGRH